ncbi:MAG: PepSY domain-containing protein [Candidatus Contendobacter sp.]
MKIPGILAKLQRSCGLAALTLASLLMVADAQAQSKLQGAERNSPTRSLEDPDRAAKAAREATGGRVLGVQPGGARNEPSDYRVRILHPDGRVRSVDVDPKSGAVRD